MPLFGHRDTACEVTVLEGAVKKLDEAIEELKEATAEIKRVGVYVKEQEQSNGD